MELTERPDHGGVQRLVRDLNRLYDELPALWQIDHHEDGFAWLDANDAHRNLYSYLRWGNEGPDGLRPVVAVVVNFSGVPQHQVHVGLPYGGRWREVLNTDAEVYGGSGQGNMGAVQAYDEPHQRQPWSALVTVPPMGAIWLVPDPVEAEEEPPAQIEQADEEPPATAAVSEVSGLEAVEDGLRTTDEPIPTATADTRTPGAVDEGMTGAPAAEPDGDDATPDTRLREPVDPGYPGEVPDTDTANDGNGDADADGTAYPDTRQS